MIHPMKHLYHLSMLVLLLAGAVLVTINLWLFWPVQTLEVLNFTEEKPVEVINKIVEPGQPLEYKLSYCKYFDGDAIVKRTLVDGQIITLQDTHGRLPLGCHESIVRTAVVPPTINPGQYYLDVVVEYRINPLRTERVHYHTDYFTVIPRAPGTPYRAVDIEEPVEIVK